MKPNYKVTVEIELHPGSEDKLKWVKRYFEMHLNSGEPLEICKVTDITIIDEEVGPK